MKANFPLRVRDINAVITMNFYIILADSFGWSLLNEFYLPQILLYLIPKTLVLKYYLISVPNPTAVEAWVRVEFLAKTHNPVQQHNVIRFYVPSRRKVLISCKYASLYPMRIKSTVIRRPRRYNYIRFLRENESGSFQSFHRQLSH
uniref:Uncharacterized protein n=1 Tax=Rhizophagus irregularis (strain DAOM 181602 / DAOM 197198 / MUCL 43194) TaxID=747089 RepID=U9SZD2_RHIID